MGTWERPRALPRASGAILAALVVALALAAAGCGGADAADEPGLRLADAVQGGRFGHASPGPGEAALAFVEAARRGDAAALWTLLSAPSRASTGPTLEAFARAAAPRLAEDFARFRGARVLFSRRLPDGWGVGAVVGRYQPEDGDSEPAAYAAALRREPDGWRVELGAVHIARLDPAPLSETDARPTLGAEAQAGGEITRMLMWLDDRPVEDLPSHRGPFTADLRGRLERALEPGPHAVVVFAASPDGAGALAWPFEVER